MIGIQNLSRQYQVQFPFLIDTMRNLSVEWHQFIFLAKPFYCCGVGNIQHFHFKF